MKAISVQQPYAWLIIHGGKDVENRNKRTRKLGEIVAIHASLQPHPAEHFPRGAKRPREQDLKYQAIVGFAEIVGCAEKGTKHSKWHNPDCFGWILENPITLPEPIKCKGGQGFWNVPASVLRRCNKQLGPQPKVGTFRYGAAKKRGEGLRIGTTRTPPRGIKKTQWHNHFDVWFRELAPSQRLRDRYGAGKLDIRGFFRDYEKELSSTVRHKQALQLVAAISLRTPISVGCNCKDESLCHRSRLKLLIERKARTLRCKP